MPKKLPLPDLSRLETRGLETLAEKQQAVLAELLKAGASAYEAGDSELATCYIQAFNLANKKWLPATPKSVHQGI